MHIPVRFHSLPLVLVLTLAIAACQTEAPTIAPDKRPPRTTPTDKPAPDAVTADTSSGTPGPLATATATPTPLATPVVAATLAPPNLLVPPPGIAPLTGTLKLDASYIVAAGAGNVLSHNGGLIVAAGGGNVISHNGGTVLSHNGGLIVAVGGGNVISHNGSAVISHNGGLIVAAGGGNIVAAGGGNIVAAGGGNYKLVQAIATPSDNEASRVAVGQLVVAAGVEIAARSAKTGQYLPIGKDSDGNDVYVIFSDLDGNYTIYPPAGVDPADVIIEAAVAREKKDPRLDYRMYRRVGATLDEDTAIVTEALCAMLAIRLEPVILASDYKEALRAFFGGSLGEKRRFGDIDENNPLFKLFFEPLLESLKKSGLQAADLDTRKAYARLFADAILTSFPYQTCRMKPGVYWDGPEEDAVPAMLQILRHARDGATQALADPNYFARGRLRWFDTMNDRYMQRNPQSTPYTIQKPADLVRLVVQEYLAVPSGSSSHDFSPPMTAPEDCTTDCNFSFDALATLLKAIKANDLPPGVTSPSGRWKQTDRLAAAVEALVRQIFDGISTGDSHAITAADAVMGIIEGYANKKASSTPSPTP